MTDRERLEHKVVEDRLDPRTDVVVLFGVPFTIREIMLGMGFLSLFDYSELDSGNPDVQVLHGKTRQMVANASDNIEGAKHAQRSGN